MSQLLTGEEVARFVYGWSPGADCRPSSGPTPYGFDLRLDRYLSLRKGDFVLAAAVERLEVPRDVLVQLFGKSTWMRRGLWTPAGVLHPGWRGVPVLEFQAVADVEVLMGDGVVHLVAWRGPPTHSYAGLYQDQGRPT